MKWHLIRWIGVGVDDIGLMCVKLVVDEGTEISARGESLNRAFTCALDKLEPALRQDELEPPTMLPWERTEEDA